jgi:hypothetical protein
VIAAVQHLRLPAAHASAISFFDRSVTSNGSKDRTGAGL